ncbi:triokinase/FMN cyclase-like [Schistocerca piceifrons]|uniref:triokinase/FMN cyclase-like n=1 Tax=Schistocerca piceifrons TaxID=274613 RepID=UPI001F5E908E|nr:triokinase/FMN cyclase-like [Schistocerca piceifrons]
MSSKQVHSALMGFVSVNPGLVLLGNEHVVMRRDHAGIEDKVKLLSGGEAGHDPWPAGFVGPGMLTAAVVGAGGPPPSDVILRTIRELARNNSAGILIIVQNYSSHHYHFGIAAERALNEDLKVKILIVGDDLLPSERFKGRRGLAGAILIQKIAGAMAERGCNLEEIFDLCRSVALRDLTTISVNLVRERSAVVLNEVEIMPDPSIGLITSQSPAEVVELNVQSSNYRELRTTHRPYTSPANAVQMVLQRLMRIESTSCATLQSDPLVVLINNLGNDPRLEEYLFTYETVKQLDEKGYNVRRAYCGSLFTAREASGFSVTAFRLSNPEELDFLDAPTLAPAWPQKSQTLTGKEEHLLKLLETVKPKSDVEIQEEDPHYECGSPIPEKLSSKIQEVLKFAAKTLIACEKQLNLFDDFGGDKDCGTKIRKGSEVVVNGIDSGEITARSLCRLFHTISEIAENIMAGASGALYSAFFEAVSKVFDEDGGPVTVCETKWLEALEFGTDAMFRICMSTVGDGTFLDPLSAAVVEWRQQLVASHGATPDWVDRLASVVAAAERSAAATADQRTDTGTAVVPDPGAHAVALWLRACFEVGRMLF